MCGSGVPGFRPVPATCTWEPAGSTGQMVGCLRLEAGGSAWEALSSIQTIVIATCTRITATARTIDPTIGLTMDRATGRMSDRTIGLVIATTIDHVRTRRRVAMTAAGARRAAAEAAAIADPAPLSIRAVSAKASVLDPLRIDDRVLIPPADLSWTAVRSSGPGGQNVNKVASKVALRFDLHNTQALSPAVKARLRSLAHGRLDADGRIQIVSQKTRDQGRNLKDSLDKLAELVRMALTPPKPRRPTKPTRGSRARRVEAKQRQAHKKILRGRVTSED